jgi:hypothetical protein
MWPPLDAHTLTDDRRIEFKPQAPTAVLVVVVNTLWALQWDLLDMS